MTNGMDEASAIDSSVNELVNVGETQKEEVMKKIFIERNEGPTEGPMVTPVEQARLESARRWGSGANVVRLGSASLADRSHLTDANHDEELRDLRSAFARVVERRLASGE